MEVGEVMGRKKEEYFRPLAFNMSKQAVHEVAPFLVEASSPDYYGYESLDNILIQSGKNVWVVEKLSSNSLDEVKGHIADFEAAHTEVQIFDHDYGGYEHSEPYPTLAGWRPMTDEEKAEYKKLKELKAEYQATLAQRERELAERQLEEARKTLERLEKKGL